MAKKQKTMNNSEQFKQRMESLNNATNWQEFGHILIDIIKDNELSIETVLQMAMDYGQQHPNWISVEDELPKEHFCDTSSEWVLICTSKGGVFIDSYNHKHHEWVNNRNDVTHWMHLPQPPRKEE